MPIRCCTWNVMPATRFTQPRARNWFARLMKCTGTRLDAFLRAFTARATILTRTIVTALNLCAFAMRCWQSNHFRWLSFPACCRRLSPATVVESPSNQAPTRDVPTCGGSRYIVWEACKRVVSAGGCDRPNPVRVIASAGWLLMVGSPAGSSHDGNPARSSRSREKVFSNPLGRGRHETSSGSITQRFLPTPPKQRFWSRN